jgi:hypothetical protein
MNRPVSLACILLVCAASAQSPQESPKETPTAETGSDFWWAPGLNAALFSHTEYPNALGYLGLRNAAGTIHTILHPFFEPIGSNGRACVSCHQPAHAMSVAGSMIRERWKVTKGKDPIFAAVDGSNCPSLPQTLESSHSLLLNRGLIRIPLAWPPKDVQPEFTIEVVRDPGGCNLDGTYGVKSAAPMVSVFRRPRMAANLPYVISTGGVPSGQTLAREPDTGNPVALNLMADGRELSLLTQARSALTGHMEAHKLPSGDDLKMIVEFESALFAGQIFDTQAGDLDEPATPAALNPIRLADAVAKPARGPVFGSFNGWPAPGSGKSAEEREMRASIARGSEIFQNRKFPIAGVAHFNTGPAPVQGTCATCHSTAMTGQAPYAGWMDVGTTNHPTWTEGPSPEGRGELPVFKLTCRADAAPHPYLGRIIYTSDPGRALISGKCADIGAIVMQQLRGLAARAPYFANGSAQTLEDMVDYYDRRFAIKLTAREKQDLVNFLGVL